MNNTNFSKQVGKQSLPTRKPEMEITKAIVTHLTVNALAKRLGHDLESEVSEDIAVNKKTFTEQDAQMILEHERQDGRNTVYTESMLLQVLNDFSTYQDNFRKRGDHEENLPPFVSPTERKRLIRLVQDKLRDSAVEKELDQDPAASNSVRLSTKLSIDQIKKEYFELWEKQKGDPLTRAEVQAFYQKKYSKVEERPYMLNTLIEAAKRIEQGDKVNSDYPKSLLNDAAELVALKAQTRLAAREERFCDMVKELQENINQNMQINFWAAPSGKEPPVNMYIGFTNLLMDYGHDREDVFSAVRWAVGNFKSALGTNFAPPKVFDQKLEYGYADEGRPHIVKAQVNKAAASPLGYAMLKSDMNEKDVAALPVSKIEIPADQDGYLAPDGEHKKSITVKHAIEPGDVEKTLCEAERSKRSNDIKQHERYRMGAVHIKANSMNDLIQMMNQVIPEATIPQSDKRYEASIQTSLF
jgi:hypothetical protein